MVKNQVQKAFFTNPGLNFFVALRQLFKKYWFFVAGGLFLFLSLYTRFTGLNWGLPYPMHPDERNMAVALTQLSCERADLANCLNPHFFAYGQLPLYLGYFLLMGYKWLFSFGTTPISFTQAVLVLRAISAFGSFLTILILLKITYLFFPNLKSQSRLSGFFSLTSFSFIVASLFIFSPGLIQLAHFGTTESLLMFFYLLILFFSLKLFLEQMSIKKYIFVSGVFSGLAVATKVSALIFTVVPLAAIIWYFFKNGQTRKLLSIFFATMNMLSLTLIIGVLASPYNLIDFTDFIGSMRYETDVATGRYIAFYTQQFVNSVPLVFQFINIFSYSLGWPILLLFLLGFFLFPTNRLFNIIRLAFLVYFLPSAFLFVKWTRFMAPVFPIMVLLAVLLLVQIYLILSHLSSRSLVKFDYRHGILRFIFLLIIIAAALPGVAYLSVYLKPDVRFQASEWIYKNIPAQAHILSETANVVDMPIENPTSNRRFLENKHYSYSPFNFYELENVPVLQAALDNNLKQADYIFVPSRRVFMNFTCEKPDSGQLRDQNPTLIFFSAYWVDRCAKLEYKYPQLVEYYRKLFSGKLGFKKVAEFASFPQIELLGQQFVVFPDETAEESYSAFDHPVIRIYQRQL